jgi:hypothetical protein
VKMKVTLSPNEVEEIIKEYLQQKFTNVGEVKMEVSRELRGHYTNEYYETVFKGATCEVES